MFFSFSLSVQDTVLKEKLCEAELILGCVWYLDIAIKTLSQFPGFDKVICLEL